VAEPIDELRALASNAQAPGERLSPYLAKVRTRAYSVTDADVEELKRAGLSEDEIFEATVSVAIAEGLRRLDAATRVIG
jgi:alkylhydroperoxidase family enzyme